MPDFSWSTFFIMVASLTIIKVVFVIWGVFHNLQTLERLIGLLSVETFRTQCEMIVLYELSYRSGGRKIYNALAISAYLPKLEDRKIAIGRESNQRCGCDREYCLSYNYRNGKRSKNNSATGVSHGKYA